MKRARENSININFAKEWIWTYLCFQLFWSLSAKIIMLVLIYCSYYMGHAFFTVIFSKLYITTNQSYDAYRESLSIKNKETLHT